MSQENSIFPNKNNEAVEVEKTEKVDEFANEPEILSIPVKIVENLKKENDDLLEQITNIRENPSEKGLDYDHSLTVKLSLQVSENREKIKEMLRKIEASSN